MAPSDIVVVALAISIPVVILSVVVNRIWLKKGLSVRAIQFIGVAIGIPIIGILALEKTLNGDVVGTLLGGIFGYLLGNISNYDKTSND